jgi:hypothetical protein
MALRFVTTEAKVRWDKVALDVVVGALFGDVVSNNYSGKATVVAVNTAGNTTWSRPWTRTRALRTGWMSARGTTSYWLPKLGARRTTSPSFSPRGDWTFVHVGKT